MTKCSERASIYKFAVRCPVCHRKLMTVRRTRNAMPNAEIIDSAKAVAYGEETRCPSCHSYVGVTI